MTCTVALQTRLVSVYSHEHRLTMALALGCCSSARTRGSAAVPLDAPSSRSVFSMTRGAVPNGRLGPCWSTKCWERWQRWEQEQCWPYQQCRQLRRLKQLMQQRPHGHTLEVCVISSAYCQSRSTTNCCLESLLGAKAVSLRWKRSAQQAQRHHLSALQ